MNKINWNFKRHFSVELQKKKNDAERQAYIQASPTIFHLQLSLYFPVRLQRAPSSSLSGCVFHTLFNIKGLDCFRKKNSSNACIFPHRHLKVCVSAQTHRSSFVLCARECLCVCAFAPRSLVPTSQRAHLAPVRPPPCAASARFVGTLQPQQLLSRFHRLSFFFFQHHVPHGENIAHTSRLSHCSPTSRPSVSPRR